MTPRARRIVEKRKQRSDAVFERHEKARQEEKRTEILPSWYPPTREQDYVRDEDLSSSRPGESDD